MNIIEITRPNKAKITISKIDYNNNQQYCEYMDKVKCERVAKELCRIDDIINDEQFWKYHKKYRHENVFGKVYNYNIRSFKSYKQVLLTIADQLRR